MASPIKSNYLKAIAHLGALLTASAWGTSFLCTKVLMTGGGFTPTEMYVYRFALAYLLLLVFTFRKIKSDDWRDECLFMLCGVCAGSLYFITENYALQNTSTANVSLLGSISPLFTAAIMALVFRTKVGAGVVIGSIVAFAGVACVISIFRSFHHPQTILLRSDHGSADSIYAAFRKRTAISSGTPFRLGSPAVCAQLPLPGCVLLSAGISHME